MVIKSMRFDHKWAFSYTSLKKIIEPAIRRRIVRVEGRISEDGNDSNVPARFHSQTTNRQPNQRPKPTT